MTNQGPARRRQPTTAPRPMIALTIERVHACALRVSELLDGSADIPADVLFRVAADALEATSGGEPDVPVVRALDLHVRQTVAAELSVKLDELTARTGLHLDTLGSEAALTLAAGRCGIDIDPDAGPVVMQLSRSRRWSARTLLEVHRLTGLHHWLASGQLRRVLADVWHAVAADIVADAGALDRVVRARTAAGIDAERLAWAAMMCESHNHIALIWHEANKLTTRYRDVDPSDMLGFGWQGLRAALRSYDPAVAAFSTYACPRINGAIRDGIRAEQPIPKRLTTLVNQAAKAEEALTHELGRSPELAELATKIGAKMDEMRLLPRLVASASIEELSAHDDSDRDAAGMWLADHEDPEGLALSTVRADAVAGALAELPVEEAEAVRLLLLDGLRPAEAAEVAACTTRQLRTRKNRGLERLSQLLADWAPTDQLTAV